MLNNLNSVVTVVGDESPLNYSVPRKPNFGSILILQYNLLFILEHFLGKKICRWFFSGWRASVRKKMLLRVSKQGIGRRLRLPTFSGLTKDSFQQEFMKKNIPVVFKGLARDWVCCKKWNLDYLKEMYGDDQVTIWSHDGYGAENQPAEFNHQSLAEFISGLQRGETNYARFIPLLQKHPELREDIDQQWMGEHMKLDRRIWMRFYKLFIGAKGTQTATHNAGNGNFFVQIEGKKKWRFFMPDTTPILDPEANRTIFKNSEFNPDEPDYEKFPMARHMDYYEVTLEPGDVMYNPPYVWHHVSNPTPSIGLACRWNDLRRAVSSSPLLATMELFNTSPNLFTGMKMTLDDFNKVIALKN